ncbi:hypothetical protein WM2015_2377 [Wenzhouxiangella marina]|uniref:Uncharacterized protein n=1 Tax=Wenzhouxiangella marina TaxID=1579979 RepID=A0A0K0XYH6_9GAMM|nr:hypothetical protein WM2015_2377 [Wenzhouxiangella marina]
MVGPKRRGKPGRFACRAFFLSAIFTATFESRASVPGVLRARPTSTPQTETRRRSGPRPRRSISQASPPTRRRDPPTAIKNPTHTSCRRQPGPNEAIATDRQWNGWPPHPPRCLGHPCVGLPVMSATLRRRVDGDAWDMDRRAHARPVSGAALLACGQPHHASNLRWPDLRFADTVLGAPPLPINGTPDHRMPRARPTSTPQIETRRRSGPRPRRSMSLASPSTRRRDPPTAIKCPTHTSRRRRPAPNEAIAADRQRERVASVSTSMPGTSVRRVVRDVCNIAPSG